MNKTKLIFLAGLLFQIGAAFAQKKNATLEIGSPAPELYIQKWIKGEPIKEFESGKAYLIEFSGVNCLPCRKAIPHLSEISNQYSGRLEVLSIYTLESNLTDPKDLSYLESITMYIKQNAAKISYHVAADVPELNTYQKWVKAVGMGGIPALVLIDTKGQISWFGHMEGVDNAIAALFPEEITVGYIVKKPAEQQLAALFEKIGKLKQGGNITAVTQKMDSVIATQPGNMGLYEYKFRLLVGVDDDQAYKSLQWLLDHQGVSNYNWHDLVYPSAYKAKIPNFIIAHQIADRAIEAAKLAKFELGVASALREKGMVYHKQGDKENAIACGTKALEIAKNNNANQMLIESFESHLKSFQTGYQATTKK